MLNEGRSLIGLCFPYISVLWVIFNADDKWESSIIVHIIKMDSANAILNWRILSVSKSSRLHVIQRLFFSLSRIRRTGRAVQGRGRPGSPTDVQGRGHQTSFGSLLLIVITSKWWVIYNNTLTNWTYVMSKSSTLVSIRFISLMAVLTNNCFFRIRIFWKSYFQKGLKWNSIDVPEVA